MRLSSSRSCDLAVDQSTTACVTLLMVFSHLALALRQHCCRSYGVQPSCSCSQGCMCFMSQFTFSTMIASQNWTRVAHCSIVMATAGRDSVKLRNFSTLTEAAIDFCLLMYIIEMSGVHVSTAPGLVWSSLSSSRAWRVMESSAPIVCVSGFPAKKHAYGPGCASTSLNSEAGVSSLCRDLTLLTILSTRCSNW